MTTVLFYKYSFIRKLLCTFQIIYILHLGFFSTMLYAQKLTYKIQENDLLKISFWESPELDRQARVSSDGKIVLPVIGNLTAAGLSIDEFRKEIITQMGTYNKLINQVNISVVEFGQNKVHVTGQITKPGKYSFEEIPNIWDIILEAGGPLESTQLNAVVIIRNQEDGKIVTADIENALKQGKINDLPQIYAGDAIHIPGINSPFGVTDISSDSYSSRNEYYIVGAINAPGTHTFEKNLNILDAIGRAGGPTEMANLEEVKYVSVYTDGTKVLAINLESYMTNPLYGTIPLVTPGSTIYIPSEERMSPILAAILITTVSTAISTILVIYISDAMRD